MKDNITITKSIIDAEENLNQNLKIILEQENILKPKLKRFRKKVKLEIEKTIKDYQEKYNLVIIPFINDNKIDIKIFCDLRTFKHENFLQEEFSHHRE